jgi:hypothetical protein
MKIARSFNCGFSVEKIHQPRRGDRNSGNDFSAAPAGLDGLDGFCPQLKLRAILGCPVGTEPVAAPSPNTATN